MGRRLFFALYLLVFTATLINIDTAIAADPGYKVAIDTYTVPDVVLTDQFGKKIHLKELLQSDEPVILDFIFGTCTTICPVLSAGFAGYQRRLGPDTRRVRLVSISIDPENDTPKVMREYLKHYDAKPGWVFLTGSRADIDKVMQAFDAYVSNKMSHYPLTFIRLPKDRKWVRINGLLSASELADECAKAGIK